jgi:predicted dehydrogenase
MIGWGETFVHEFHHFFDAIVNNKPVEPWGATFVDGYRNAVISDAILESAATGRSVDIKYEV